MSAALALPAQKTTHPAAGTEAELIRLAQLGVPEAFDALYDRHWRRVRSYLSQQCSRRADAEQLAQDVFLKAWLALPRTAPGLRFGAWVDRIALNVWRDEYRHQQVVRWQPWADFLAHPGCGRYLEAPDTTDGPVLAREAGAAVRAVLAQLPAHWRLALVLREYQEMGYDEIAGVMRTTRSTVKSLLHRARERFRELAPGMALGPRLVGRHKPLYASAAKERR